MNTATRERIAVGPISIQFRVESSDSNGSVTVFECTVPPQVPVPAAHSHDGFEETIYGLAGVLTWTVDGHDVAIGPGQSVCIPRGAVHGFVNHGDVDATVLCIATPGVFKPAYFKDIAAVLTDSAAGPLDRGAMIDVMRRHGLTPALSPSR
jgi:quercetin dioxygenase-like cupin family protein